MVDPENCPLFSNRFLSCYSQEAIRLADAGEAELKRLEHPDPYRVRHDSI
jgi:hypothetical protein